MVNMNFYEKLAKGLCPNDCGEMFEPEQPIYVWTLVPLDVLEAYHESTTKPEPGDIDFDRVALVAICPICSFVLTMNVDPEHNPGGAGMVHIEHVGEEENLDDAVSL